MKYCAGALCFISFLEQVKEVVINNYTYRVFYGTGKIYKFPQNIGRKGESLGC